MIPICFPYCIISYLMGRSNRGIFIVTLSPIPSISLILISPRLEIIYDNNRLDFFVSLGIPKEHWKHDDIFFKYREYDSKYPDIISGYIYFLVSFYPSIYLYPSIIRCVLSFPHEIYFISTFFHLGRVYQHIITTLFSECYPYWI